MAKSYKKHGATVKATPVMLLDVSERKARNLPMFGRGIAISVPLNLLPAYLALYSLQVMSKKDIHDRAVQGIHKPDGVLWERREVE
jgi:hypothetical protein